LNERRSKAIITAVVWAVLVSTVGVLWFRARDRFPALVFEEAIEEYALEELEISLSEPPSDAPSME
jgi:hypothetical protein